MQVDLLTQTGQSAGSVSLNDNVFAIQPNTHCIYLDVKRILANRRQGTHKTKTRAEVHGTNRKPFRQKGTGGARQGDVKSPLQRHGGTVFGPEPRSYEQKVNKKVSRLARRSALSIKAAEQNVRIVQHFTFNTPRTREFLSVLEKLKLSGKKVLFVTPEVDQNLVLSTRNIEGFQILPAQDLNTYDIMRAGVILIQDKALDVVNQTLDK